MDIRIERDSEVALEDVGNYFEGYAREQLAKYFISYPFIQSVQVYFRGDKHPTKKVKLNMRLKGKDIYAEASGELHDQALDNAITKIYSQLEKYKSQHYQSAQ